MNKQDRKKLKEKHRQTNVPMGVFLIRNNVSDKVFVAAGRNLQGIINRHRFQLIAGSHPNSSLQADWSRLGSQNFAFEILEEFIPPDDSDIDEAKELAFMETLWVEKLKPFDERGYNEPKLSREEKLRRISANNLSNGGI